MDATILALVLATAPTPFTPTAYAPFEVSDVETEIGEPSVHLATFDGDGDQSAEVVVWSDPGNRVRVDANFADGLYLSAFVDDAGRLVELDSDDPEEAAARMQAVGDYLAAVQPQESTEALCMLGVIAVVGQPFARFPRTRTRGRGLVTWKWGRVWSDAATRSSRPSASMEPRLA